MRGQFSGVSRCILLFIGHSPMSQTALRTLICEVCMASLIDFTNLTG